MKHIYILFLLALGNVNAQIAISSSDNFVMDPRAAVHIDKGNNVVKLPHVSLNYINDRETVTNPSIGLMVYNVSTEEKPGAGFCYWDGNKWVNYSETRAVVANNISTQVSINALGYNPVGVSTDALQSFTIRGTNNRVVTFNKVGCVKWKSNEDNVTAGTIDGRSLKSLNGNDHVYCGYTSSLPTDWGETFKAAKSQKGYMVTITSKSEWEFIVNAFYRDKDYYYEDNTVKSNNLNFRTNIADTRRVWIGYNKSNIVGSHQQFSWITGEVSEIDWIKGERFSGFAANEPNDSQGVEGCSHIHSYNDPVVSRDLNKLTWNDTPCNLGTVNHTSIAPYFHIFEFNE